MEAFRDGLVAYCLCELLSILQIEKLTLAYQ